MPLSSFLPLSALLTIGSLLLSAGCHTTEAELPPLPPAFDVPSLMGKNISQIEATLGAAEKTTGPTALDRVHGTPNDGQKSWSKDTGALIIQFDQGTGLIRYFYVSCGRLSPQPTFGSEDEALNVGALKRDAPNYHLKFVPDKEAPGRFWAVEAIPNT